jgi:hypothetical protein
MRLASYKVRQKRQAVLQLRDGGRHNVWHKDCSAEALMPFTAVICCELWRQLLLLKASLDMRRVWIGVGGK